MTSEGRIWKFGDDVNTDLIIPGRYLDDCQASQLASHAMEGVNAEFASEVREGDIILAGANFGCGSSREQAIIALKACGIRAIVATSFARIFYRNAINLGMRIYESPEAWEVFNDGDEAMLDAAEERLISVDRSRKASLREIPHHLKDIVRDGGLVPHIKRRFSSR